jgi:hypothetical protein
MAAPLAPSAPTETAIPVPVWAWLAAAGAAFLVYLMAVENGALLGSAAEQFHEFFHDGRHFIGVPCH